MTPELVPLLQQNPGDLGKYARNSVQALGLEWERYWNEPVAPIACTALAMRSTVSVASLISNPITR